MNKTESLYQELKSGLYVTEYTASFLGVKNLSAAISYVEKTRNITIEKDHIGYYAPESHITIDNEKLKQEVKIMNSESQSEWFAIKILMSIVLLTTVLLLIKG